MGNKDVEKAEKIVDNFYNDSLVYMGNKSVLCSSIGCIYSKKKYRKYTIFEKARKERDNGFERVFVWWIRRGRMMSNILEEERR